MRGVLAVALGAMMVSSVGVGAPPAKSVAAELAPEFTEHVKFFREKRPEWEQNRRAVLLKQAPGPVDPQQLPMPDDPQKQSELLRQDSRLRDLFYRFLETGELPSDLGPLRDYAGNKVFPTNDRIRAMLLLYLATDDPEVMARLLLESPSRVSLFLTQKDPTFPRVLQLMLSRALEESTQVYCSQTPVPTPYTETLSRYYSKWIAAAYRYEVPSQGLRMLWDLAPVYRLGHPVRSRDTSEVVYKTFRDVAPAHAMHYIRYLLDSGRDGDVLVVLKAFPDDSERIRATVSDFRLRTKQRLDDTLALMRAAQAAPIAE